MSLLGDSSGFSIMQYEDWEDAKRGLISRRRFVKLHILTDVCGRRIISCEATRGTARLALVSEDLRKGAWWRGCVMLDAAYDAYANYRMIRDSGRRPVIDPRRDHVIRGYSPRAAMLRWRQENPEEFARLYHRRSLVESTFSSIKARFGAVVTAKTLPLQRLQLILKSICYNLLS